MIGTQFLQSHALFGGLTDDQIALIRPLLREQSFEIGEYIVTEGQEGDRLFFLCAGSVSVLKADADTGSALTHLATLRVGDTFGEMEILDIQPRCASVKALESVQVLILTCHDLYAIYKADIKAYSLIVLNLARELSRRLRKSDALIASALYASQRVATSKE
jgi:CRP/FNR family cyclic AMP-dependent transcriptional regulator